METAVVEDDGVERAQSQATTGPDLEEDISDDPQFHVQEPGDRKPAIKIGGVILAGLGAGAYCLD